MKKRNGIKRALDEISFSDLESFPTAALLARLKRLRFCYENPKALSDFTDEELESVKDKILFKSDPRWQQAYADLKQILAQRDNLTHQ